MEMVGRNIVEKTTQTKKDNIDKNGVVIVKGFLVVYKLPSHNILKTFFPKFYDNVKIGYEAVQLVRGYFYNKVIRLAQKFYEILNKYTINIGFGYLLPLNNVDDFMEEVEKLRHEYEKYQKDFEAFVYEGKIPTGVRKDAIFDMTYLGKVREYLEKVSDNTEIHIPNIAGRFRVNLIPFSLDVSYLYDYIDDETKRIVDSEIQKISKQLIEQYEKEMRERIEKIIKKLEKYQNKRVNKRFIKSLEKEINFIESMMNSLGVTDDSKIRALKEALSSIKENRIVTSDNVENIRVKALKEQFIKIS